MQMRKSVSWESLFSKEYPAQSTALQWKTARISSGTYQAITPVAPSGRGQTGSFHSPDTERGQRKRAAIGPGLWTVCQAKLFQQSALSFTCRAILRWREKAVIASPVRSTSRLLRRQSLQSLFPTSIRSQIGHEFSQKNGQKTPEKV
jgi:hypothetical protein